MLDNPVSSIHAVFDEEFDCQVKNSQLGTPEAKKCGMMFLHMSMKFLEVSRNFLEMCRSFLEISKNFLEVSRTFLDMSKNVLEISSSFFTMSRKFL